MRQKSGTPVVNSPQAGIRTRGASDTGDDDKAKIADRARACSVRNAGRIAGSKDIAAAVRCASRDVMRRPAAHRSLKARRLDDQHIALQRIENPLGRMADQRAPDARTRNCTQRHDVRGLAPGNTRKKLCGVAFENLDAVIADIVVSRECQDLVPDPLPVSSTDVLLHAVR